jgi:hypothetical protein
MEAAIGRRGAGRLQDRQHVRGRPGCDRVWAPSRARGLADVQVHAGRGLANMRARASRVGAHLEIADQHPGVRVSVGLTRPDALVA